MFWHSCLLRVSWSPCFRGSGSKLGQCRYLLSCMTKGIPTSTNFQFNVSVRESLPVHLQGLYIWIQVFSLTTDGPMPQHNYSFALCYGLLQQVVCSRFARPYVYEKIVLTWNNVSDIMWNMYDSQQSLVKITVKTVFGNMNCSTDAVSSCVFISRQPLCLLLHYAWHI
jgi:hypothetical protein